jgi:hypothetical protein
MGIPLNNLPERVRKQVRAELEKREQENQNRNLRMGTELAEQIPVCSLDDQKSVQSGGHERTQARYRIRIECHRKRALDPDNKVSAVKEILDCLQELDFLPGDSEKEIDLDVRQLVVRGQENIKTVIEIEEIIL